VLDGEIAVFDQQLRSRFDWLRGRLLRAALCFVALRVARRCPALDVLHRYMDGWRGVGAVAAAMAR
jgi:hypothetical protein